MKKIALPALAAFLLFLAACSNSNDKKNGSVADNKDSAQTRADSLMAEVMDGHDVGMAKYGKLNSVQNEVQRILDSIAKLPAKARDAAAPLKSNMEVLLVDLKTAKEGMDKWMSEFDMDSAVNNLDRRLKYLAEEKLKVSKVKEGILWSLHKADSLLKAKF